MGLACRSSPLVALKPLVANGRPGFAVAHVRRAHHRPGLVRHDPQFPPACPNGVQIEDPWQTWRLWSDRFQVI
jgi:hypothetical protein